MEHHEDEALVPSITSLLLALALVASACGNGDDGTTGNGTTDDGATDGRAAPSGDDVTITLARFFGDCDESTAGVTDVSEATSECEVIQILTNAFNEEDNGIFVDRLGGAVWDQYYTQLSTTFASGNPPNVAVMHSHRLPDFAGRNLLRPIADDLPGPGSTSPTSPSRHRPGRSTRARSTRCPSTSTAASGTSTWTCSRQAGLSTTTATRSCRPASTSCSSRQRRSRTPPVPCTSRRTGSSSRSARACSSASSPSRVATSSTRTATPPSTPRRARRHCGC
jgi:hypothetical protein